MDGNAKFLILVFFLCDCLHECLRVSETGLRRIPGLADGAVL